MPTYFLDRNTFAQNVGYELRAGDAFVLVPGVSLVTWDVGFVSGLYGWRDEVTLAPVGQASITIASLFSAGRIELYGGDRVLNTDTGTIILTSVMGVDLSANFGFGLTSVINQGGIHSALASGSAGITARLLGTASQAGQGFQLLNSGLIEARGIGVNLIGASNGANLSGVIENDGRISGTIAVEASGRADTIINSGQMSGSGQAVVRLFGAHSGDFTPTLVNEGRLTFTGFASAGFSHAAISVSRGASLDAHVDITNTGSIEGKGRSIYLDVDSAVIQNTGTIAGGIRSTGGSVTIENIKGTIRGAIMMGAGEDVLINSGTIRGPIDMGEGNDLLDLRGGKILGPDLATGGAGDDSYYVSIRASRIAEAADGGTDTVHAQVSYRLLDNFENLVLMETGNLTGGGNGLDNQVTGNGGNNLLTGAGGNDTLRGQEGHDTLNGGLQHDLLIGGEGDDVLIGGFGMDTLEGGAGLDRFVFLRGQSSQTTPDTITDFVPGEDVIDLSGIDADLTNGSADDAFVFIGTAAFSAVAGELRIEESGGILSVQGDVNGDGLADVVILVQGLTDLSVSDLLL